MKIKDYNDAIEFFRTNDYQAADGAWSEFYQSEVLEPRIMDQASLTDDLEPGPLKDEIAGNFDPKQETYEEYLQRINLQRPFNMAEGGQLVAPSVDGSRPGYQGPGGGKQGPEGDSEIEGPAYGGVACAEQRTFAKSQKVVNLPLQVDSKRK